MSPSHGHIPVASPQAIFPSSLTKHTWSCIACLLCQNLTLSPHLLPHLTSSPSSLESCPGNTKLLCSLCLHSLNVSCSSSDGKPPGSQAVAVYILPHSTSPVRFRAAVRLTLWGRARPVLLPVVGTCSPRTPEAHGRARRQLSSSAPTTSGDSPPMWTLLPVP